MRRRWVPTMVSLTLAAGGCSGTGSAKPTVLPPVPSATVVVTPTPTAVVPVVVPSAAVPATPQGAAAFVRFFYGELNGAFQDGHDERIRALSDPACGTCNILASAVQEGRLAGRRILGVSFRPTAVEAAPESGGADFVTVLGTVPARRISEKGVIRSLSGGRPFAHTVSLIRRGDAWLVRGVRYDKL